LCANIWNIIVDRVYFMRVPALSIPIRQLADKPVRVDGNVRQKYDGREDIGDFFAESLDKKILTDFRVIQSLNRSLVKCFSILHIAISVGRG